MTVDWRIAWQRAHPERHNKATKAYRLRNPKRTAYLRQLHHAKQRGINFKFTLKEWIEWWGTDFDKRGRSNTDLCMARIGDQGAYEPSNVVKTTHLNNRRKLI